MQDLNYLSCDIDLADRLPETELTASSSASPISIEDVHNSKEDFKQMIETMEKFKTFPRRQRRKVLKPSFSDSVKKSFQKKIQK